MAKLSNFYKVVVPNVGVATMTDNQNIGDQGAYQNFSWYQRLVQGSASRITRYREYDLMDNDVEIARSLDTIAEEMTGSDPNTDLPLVIDMDTMKTPDISHRTVQTLQAALRFWNDIHEWDIRLFKVCRITVKYGDCFFIRHSETGKWEYVAPKNVVAAVVDERDMTHVIGWQIKRDTKAPNSPINAQTGHYGNNSNELIDTVPADSVIWFSLNDDISESAPFGESILRAVYRAQKQKELLEDAIIIYRIQRAPERRVFYIDVGKMPTHRVKTHLEQIKNEIRQKKIPTMGGGVEQVDTVYNPQQMSEDFFFASRPDGKGSRVETLPGGAGLGELSDLEYFQWKVFRGLRIPLSYMREGGDNSINSDGKTGVAYIMELRFAMYVKRLQTYIERVLDKEFKRFLRAANIHIDPTTFKVRLPDPENFGVYREQQLHSDLLNTYTQADTIQHISKRMGLKMYLNWSDEDIITNFRMKCEELGIDPNNTAEALKAVYGAAVDTLGGDMGFGGGMMAGTLGGPMGAGTDFVPDVPPPGDQATTPPDVQPQQ